MIKDKRLSYVCKQGENVLKNWTPDHHFLVGDNISYQIGDYEKAYAKYRVRGFVLALGYSNKGKPMYLIGQLNMVYYDSDNDYYTSDKRTTPRWYTEKEIHADDIDSEYFPKVIGHKCCRTITRLVDGTSIHVINVQEDEKVTKTSKYIYKPEFNIPVSKLNYSVFKRYKDGSHVSEKISCVCAYRMDDQLAGKTFFESGDKDVFRVKIIKKRWDEKKSKYIKKKDEFVYYCIVDLIKK